MVDKFISGKDSVKINYLVGKNRYFLLSDKSGYPSAEFRYRGSSLVVSDTRHSSADP
ncbi:MAG: hypothetical protein M1543_03435 [Firmicutes bacterium]|nr:hypothetical protein [Bacillota bacterium]